MGAVQANHVLGDLVANRVFRIAGVLEDINECPGPSVTDEGRPPVIETFSGSPTKVVVLTVCKTHGPLLRAGDPKGAGDDRGV